MSSKGLIEASLFVAGRSVTLKDLEKISGVESKAVKDILEQLMQEYSQRDSGLLIDKTPDGYLMRVKPEFEESIVHLIPEADLSKSVLKTLALIAHEQPIKQSTLVKLKGNRVYHYVHRLEELGFINAKPESRTRMLSTTEKFKEYFKIDNVKETAEEGLKTRLPQQTLLQEDGGPEEAEEAEDD